MIEINFSSFLPKINGMIVWCLLHTFRGLAEPSSVFLHKKVRPLAVSLTGSNMKKFLNRVYHSVGMSSTGDRCPCCRFETTNKIIAILKYEAHGR